MSKKKAASKNPVGPTMETIAKADLDILRISAQRWTDLMGLLYLGLEEEIQKLAETIAEDLISELEIS